MLLELIAGKFFSYKHIACPYATMSDVIVTHDMNIHIK